MAEYVDRDTLIEDIVIKYPEAVDPLMRFGIKCIECGEPIWGTVGEAAEEKGLTEEKLDEALVEINRVIEEAKKA
jgi:methionine synthase II (cobalamin-independent)